MSPSTLVMVRPSRRATTWSCSSWRGELSSTVTRAPAAARIGACWPPALARPSTCSPASGGYHERGTGFVGVSTSSHSPRRAAAIAVASTGTVQRFARWTSPSHALRL